MELTADTETAIWERIIELNPFDLSPDLARYILAYGFSPADQERMAELVEKSQEGTLTANEKRQVDNYLHVSNLLALMHSKARCALRRAGSAA